MYPISVGKSISGFIPRVLLQAKTQALMEKENSEKRKCWDKAGDDEGGEKGPWDKGHWANRK